MAPSPDWFSGFYNFNAADTVANKWLYSFVVATAPWDAGTETGNTYDPSNPAESPQARISQFTTSNIRPTSVYVSVGSNNKKRVLPVARWECQLVSPPAKAI